MGGITRIDPSRSGQWCNSAQGRVRSLSPASRPVKFSAPPSNLSAVAGKAITAFQNCMTPSYSRTLHLEKCSPAAAHFTLPPEPQFFTRYYKPVDATMDGDGEMVSATGIAFDDYRTMGSFTKSPTYRHKTTPIYATDQNAMRKLVVRFMERRAKLPGAYLGPLPGTELERMNRAKAAILADVPRLDAQATELCRRYVDGRKNGADAEWLKMMEVAIQGVDTNLRMAREVPAIIVGVIYRSYCLAEDSVAVGAALGILPPAVRQMLSRLASTWRRIAVEEATRAAASASAQTPAALLEACCPDGGRG